MDGRAFGGSAGRQVSVYQTDGTLKGGCNTGPAMIPSTNLMILN